MGNHFVQLPIWKRGFPYGIGDFQGMCKSPFPYGDRHMETGSRFIVLPIWKRGFAYGNGDFQFAIWKRGAVSFSFIWKRGFPYGNRDSHFHMVIHVQKREAVVPDSPMLIEDFVQFFAHLSQDAWCPVRDVIYVLIVLGAVDIGKTELTLACAIRAPQGARTYP